MAEVTLHAMTSEMSLREIANSQGISREPVRRAAAVVKHASYLADAVMGGAMQLNAARACLITSTDRTLCAVDCETGSETGRCAYGVPF